MATDETYSTMRGLAILDPRISTSTLWSAQSSYTQAGNRPGTPEAQQTTDLVLETTGDQSASKSLRVRAQRPGLPGIGDQSGGFVWRYDGDALWRGCDVPSVVTGIESMVWTDGSGVTVEAGQSTVITLTDGSVLIAYYKRTTAGSGSRSIIVQRKDPLTGVWGSNSTVYSQDTTATDGFHPCFVLLPSGRVLLFHYVEDTTNNEYQIRMHYTDDKGTNWSVGSQYCLDTALDISSTAGSGNPGYTARRMSAAYLNGDISLVIGLLANDTSLTYRDVLRQVYSTDLGASLKTVATWTGASSTNAGASPCVIVVNGFFNLYYAGIAKPAVRRIASAADDYRNDTPVEMGTGAIYSLDTGTSKYIDPNPSLSAVVTDSGEIFVLAMATGSTTRYIGIVMRSVDGGLTFGNLGASPMTDDFSPWFDNGYQTTTYPRDFSACWHEGRIVLAHQWKASPATSAEDSVSVLYLGGYSTVTMPGYKLFKTDLTRVGFNETWLPYDEPAASGGTKYWTKTSSGSPTETIGSGYLLLSSTTGEKVYYNRQGTTGNAYAPQHGVIATTQLTVVAGGSIADEKIFIKSRQVDNAGSPGAGTTVSIRLSTSAIRVYDVIAAAGVGSDITIDTTAGVELLFSHKGTSFALWYRATSNSTDRKWIAGPTTTSLNDDSGAAGTGVLEWGQGLEGAAATHTSHWFRFQDNSSTAAYIGTGLWSGQTNPDDLFTRSLASSAVAINDQVKIRAIDGPAMTGDNWNIDTRYRYEIGRVLPGVQPSPRIGWRSTADNVEQRIAFQFGGHGGTGTAETLSDTICLYLAGCNWRTGKLEGWNGSAWVTIFNIDLADSLSSLPFVRKGEVITVNTAASHTGQRWILFDELVGATVDLGSSKFRKVSTNSDGVWTTATTKRPQLILEDIDNTEAASGTCNIWSTRTAVVHHLAGVKYGGYRLVIDAQHTADDYYSVGTMFIGPVVPFGQQNSWDRAISRDANTDLTTFQDGQRTARKMGPARRQVVLAWSDPVDMTNIQGHNPDPNYLISTTATGGEPIAARASTPWQLEGLIDRIDGAVDPVVYLPAIPKGSPGNSTWQFIQLYASCYGRVVSGYRSDGVVGNEMEDTAVRVSSITIEEEL